MKTIIFTFILSAVAPTFAHAAYLQSHAPYQQNARQIGVTSTATKQFRPLVRFAGSTLWRMPGPRQEDKSEYHRHVSAMKVAAVKAPRFRGANHAGTSQDNRSRYCQRYSHWWKNLGEKSVVLFVGDVRHDPKDHNM